MTWPKSRCKQFELLLDEVEDRPLQADEHSFMESHRQSCSKCDGLVRSSVGLNMLRQSSLEPIVDRGFDERVIRRFHLQEYKSSFGYWSPAIVSAAIAGLAILSAIQMISAPEQMPTFNGAGEARKSPEPVFPELRDLSGDQR